MIPPISFATATSLRRFNSVVELRKHLKKLYDDALQEMDKVNSTIGLVMRDNPDETQEQSVKGWVKFGNVFVNKSDTERATLDILFAIHREMKPRIARIEGALKSAEKLDELGIYPEEPMILMERFGVPERFIALKVDDAEKREKFSLKETYVTK